MTALLHLCAGDLALTLAPDVGGSIARFDHLGGGTRIPIMRSADAPAHATDAACFPLVPYSNRIRGGRFTFRRREVVLAPNMPGDSSPLHGQGWLSAWTVASSSLAAAELLFAHEAGEWPWAYEARQQFSLDAEGLDVTLTCRNRSDTPMPCALGLHPYFPCTPQTRLATVVTGAWTIDSDVLPVALVPATGRYDLAGRLVCGQDLDNGFDGWGSMARITDPALPFAVEMRSADAGRFQLYSPPEGGLFVAEPVQSANAALNAPEEEWPALGMAILAPGEEVRIHARVDVVPA